MTAEHDDHGSTPANWTGSIIIMVAFTIGTLGVVLAQPLVFWLGVALVAVGAIVWKVMSGMGYSSNDVG